MSEIETLKAELQEAEEALHESRKAASSHGRQAITWALMKADAKRVAELREAIAREESKT